MNYQKLKSAPTVLRDFLTYIGTIKGESDKTVEEYYLDLRTFFRFLKLEFDLVPPAAEFSLIDISDIDLHLLSKVKLADIYAFLNFCKSERSNTSTTRARKVSALRSFFKYLTEKTSQLAENPLTALDSPKTARALPKYLTLEQSIDLLNAVDGKNKERDYCILTIFLNCGLRLSELCGLNLSDIRESKIQVRGKGNKQRIVYLNDACNAAIANYLKVRPNDAVKDKNALFLSRNRKRISPKTVQYIVYTYLDKIGLGNKQGYSVHKLRHTAATLMYQHGGVDIRTLKDFLGHENLSTTEIYTHITDKNLKEASESNPLSKIKNK